jgi:AraC-like DNA-binding protein
MDYSGNDMDDFCTIIRRLAEWESRASVPRVIFVEADFGAPILTRPQPLLELLLVRQGTLRLAVGRHSERLVAGDLALMNAHFGNRDEQKDRPSCQFDCVSFKVGGEKAFADIGRRPLLIVRPMEDAEGLHQLYREVTFLFHSSPQDLAAIQFKAAILRLLVAVHGGGTTAGAMEVGGHRALRAVFEVIRERHSDSDLGLPDLAKAAHLSVDHLGRLFRAECGTSPMRYILRLRLNRARALLRRTDLSIKEVAHMTGFRDPLYFSRLFRREVGQAPSQGRWSSSSRPVGANES